MEKSLLLEALHRIPVDDLSGLDWIRLGMALKTEGCSLKDWEDWSKGMKPKKIGDSDVVADNHREMERRWNSFSIENRGANGGTIVWFAKQNEWSPKRKEDQPQKTMSLKGLKLEDPRDEFDKLLSVASKQGAEDMLRDYIETLYGPGDTIAYVTHAHKDVHGKWQPDQAQYIDYYDLQDKLNDGQTLQQIFGRHNPEAGAWISFNSFDGKGQASQNVESLKYVLIECDKIPIKEQYKTYKRLNLPIAALIHSGGRSLHAIVHIDAHSKGDYYKRVSFLYTFLGGDGLAVDTANKNPNRWTRIPGMQRGSETQRLIATNIGADDYTDWVRQITGQD